MPSPGRYTDNPHPKMPPEVAAADEQAAAATTDALGQSPPAESPLSPTRVGQVTTALNQAKDALSGGELPPLEVQVPGPVEALPPELFAEIVAMRAVVDELVQAGLEGAEQYDFDPMQMATSDEGLAALTEQFTALAQDEALLAQMQQPADTETAETPTEEVPEEDELEGLMPA